jgi:uncharacterized CHY-type Zn-finger protein
MSAPNRKMLNFVSCDKPIAERCVNCKLRRNEMSVLSCSYNEQFAKQIHKMLLYEKLKPWELSMSDQRKWIKCGKCRGWLTTNDIVKALKKVAVKLDDIVEYLEQDYESAVKNKAARQKRWRDKTVSKNTLYMREWRSKQRDKETNKQQLSMQSG